MRSGSWFRGYVPTLDYFDYNCTDIFMPYIKKVVIPEKCEEGEHRVFCFGDLHGDFHSLMKSMNYLFKNGLLDENLRLLKHTHIFFMGDYVDRGLYGVETLWFLMMLAIQNPGAVTLVRGNHEDLAMNKGDFSTEVMQKLGGLGCGDISICDKIQTFYHALPLAIAIEQGGKVALGCHGGHEPRCDEIGSFLQSEATYFAIQPFLGSDMSVAYRAKGCSLREFRYAARRVAMSKPRRPGDFGFLWNDFHPDEGCKTYDRGGRIAFSAWQSDQVFEYIGACATRAAAESPEVAKKVVAFIRAHQHASDPKDPIMVGIERGRGAYSLWGRQRDVVVAEKKVEGEVVERSARRRLLDKAVVTLGVTPGHDLGRAARVSGVAYAEVEIGQEGGPLLTSRIFPLKRYTDRVTRSVTPEFTLRIVEGSLVVEKGGLDHEGASKEEETVDDMIARSRELEGQAAAYLRRLLARKRSSGKQSGTV